VPPNPRRKFTALLLACLAISLFCVIYPIYVIRPFRAQGARELALALIVTRFRPILTLASALIALAAAIAHWRTRPALWRRLSTSLVAALTCLLAFLAHVNVYELMFHPVDHPAFAAAGELKIDPDDKVLAVKIDGTARAYPIRTMGYHHIVNDLVAGTAIVATY
jgi:hypothetical protein